MKNYNLERLDEEFGLNDLEWKVQTCGCNSSGRFWAIVVPYVTNRAIMRTLDEVFGKLNWQNTFEEIRGKGVRCGIGVLNPDTNEWIWKYDGADETQIESTKGGISSAMKRTAVQWGIGRHLYTMPIVYAICSSERPKDNYDWAYAKTPNKNGGGAKSFYWRLPDGLLQGQSSRKQKQGATEPVTPTTPLDLQEQKKISEPQRKRLFAIAAQHGLTHEQIKEALEANYQLGSTKDILVSNYEEIVESLKEYASTANPIY